MMNIKEKYPYLYETHLHTCQGSRCAKNTGEEMARACKDAGYTGIFVTEHNWGGNTCIDRSLPWKDFVTEWSRGYDSAKETGEKIGLDVFYGMETGFHGTEFLLYGITKEWLLDTPELREATVEEQFKLVHEGGGIVIHAHPYREEPYIPEIRLFPEYVDGVEGINATHSSPLSLSHNNPLYNNRAVDYAQKHGFRMTAGSDIHSVNLFGGGTAFDHKLKDPKDFIDTLLGNDDYALTDGKEWYLYSELMRTKQIIE
ncbi:MAG: PHP domain-containing protein [Lachnospiraceae bacterium]|nr:PHP domain-containing protein [Lachnospiraceae bacterium]